MIAILADVSSAELLVEALNHLEQNIFIVRMKRDLEAAIEAAC